MRLILALRFDCLLGAASRVEVDHYKVVGTHIRRNNAVYSVAA